MKNMQQVIDVAADLLNPRAGYARDVLTGYQRWSGGDLEGKARKFGAWYAGQRGAAYRALQKAGGCVVPVSHGRLVTAVYVGADDYGNAIYHTTDGVAVPRKCWCMIVRRSLV